MTDQEYSPINIEVVKPQSVTFYTDNYSTPVLFVESADGRLEVKATNMSVNQIGDLARDLIMWLVDKASYDLRESVEKHLDAKTKAQQP